MKIGVVGIGKMGRPIADRLIAAGHEVAICNRSDNAGVQVSCAEQGRDRPPLPRSGRRRRVILTALPTEDAVRQVYARDVGGGPRGSDLCRSLDGEPGAQSLVRGTRRSRGASFLDAPVSGGPAGAEAGTLTVMVGGDEATFNRALPVFEPFGSKIRLCGPVGCGQAIKLVNQLLVAVHTMASSEAAAFAVQLGADLDHRAGRHRDLVRQLGDAAAQPPALHRARLQPGNADRPDREGPVDHPHGGGQRRRARCSSARSSSSTTSRRRRADGRARTCPRWSSSGNEASRQPRNWGAV